MMSTIVTAVILLSGCAAAADRESVARGAKVFTAQGCYGCHMVGQTGTPIATDLTRVGTRFSEKELRLWLADPRAQKPTAHMPKLVLTEVEINSLATYLASLR